METFVDLKQAAAGDVSINLGRANAGMTEQFLDDAQICTVLEQVRGETVPQHMRCYIALDASEPDATFDSLPQGRSREGGAPAREKDGRRRATGHQLGTTRLKIATQGGGGLPAQRDDSFLVALANNRDESHIQMQLFQSDLAQLGKAQPRGVGQFENGLAAKRLRRRLC